jgi:CubicO group peptidase (beta-lactamase class C family)
MIRFFIKKHNVGIIIMVMVCLIINSNKSFADFEVGKNETKVKTAVMKIRQNLASTLANKLPSLNLLIQTPNEIIFVSAADSPEQEITKDTYFRFASNTKNFTATAILKMHQDGWLNISNHIVDMIPGSTIPYLPGSPKWDVPHKKKLPLNNCCNIVPGFMMLIMIKFRVAVI